MNLIKTISVLTVFIFIGLVTSVAPTQAFFYPNPGYSENSSYYYPNNYVSSNSSYSYNGNNYLYQPCTSSTPYNSPCSLDVPQTSSSYYAYSPYSNGSNYYYDPYTNTYKYNYYNLPLVNVNTGSAYTAYSNSSYASANCHSSYSNYGYNQQIENCYRHRRF